MSLLFADTYYWIALTNPRDSAHRQVMEFTARLGPLSVITTDEVFTEFLAYCASDGQLRREGGLAVRELLNDPDIRIIPQSANLISRGTVALHGPSRQGLQSYGLHFDANNAAGTLDRRFDERPAFRAGRLSGAVSGLLEHPPNRSKGWTSSKPPLDPVFHRNDRFRISIVKRYTSNHAEAAVSRFRYSCHVCASRPRAARAHGEVHCLP